MRKQIFSISVVVILTLLCLYTFRVYCLNESLKERAIQYEQNIEDYCVNENDFIQSSDSGSTMTEPMGRTSTLHAFTYYENDNKLKQIYKGDKYVCIVTWTEGEEIPEYLRYLHK